MKPDPSCATKKFKKTKGRRACNFAETFLPGNPRALLLFDEFLRGINFLTSRQLAKLVITGDETLSNLLNHGQVGQKGIYIRIRKTGRVVLLMICVESHESFRIFAERYQKGDLPGPRFNKELKRWHGLGLSMCQNLTKKLVYRAGEITDRIFMEY